MNTKMDGREVTQFMHTAADGNPYRLEVGSWIPDNYGAAPIMIKSIHLSATYHGDRDEFWVVAVCEDGSEVRYNPKALDYFHLAPEGKQV